DPIGIALGEFRFAEGHQVALAGETGARRILSEGRVVLDKRRELELAQMAFQQGILLHDLLLSQTISTTVRIGSGQWAGCQSPVSSAGRRIAGTATPAVTGRVGVSIAAPDTGSATRRPEVRKWRVAPGT